MSLRFICLFNEPTCPNTALKKNNKTKQSWFFSKITQNITCFVHVIDTVCHRLCTHIGLFQHWCGVQSLIGRTGKDSLKRRVASFDVKKVRAETLHRAQELLSLYDLTIVQEASAGAATFYLWVSLVCHILSVGKSGPTHSIFG